MFSQHAMQFKPGVHLLFTALIMALSLWLNTGTMAPYAASTTSPFYTKDCQYPVNIDHPHFIAPYMMLKGAPPEYWTFSVTLRRILYSVIAYPFMETFGFMEGGLLANLLLHLFALGSLFWYLKKEYGPVPATVGAWLFASYPGIPYWSGLPYSYAIIVPCTMVSMIFLDKIEKTSDLLKSALCAFGLGVMFTGYDLMWFFGIGAFGIPLLRKQFLRSLVVGLCLLLPPLAINLWLNMQYNVGLLNANTAIYFNIVNAYKSLNFGSEWLSFVMASPLLLARVFFTSNFYFLPLVFLVSLFVLWKKKLNFSKAEASVLLSAFAIFIFNNWAPPYEGWQMRGEWIARIYQPIFAVFIFFTARKAPDILKTLKKRQRAVVLFSVGIILNLSICFGSILSIPIASWAWYHFYQHSAPLQTYEAVEKLGKRPFGICNKDIK